MYVKNGIIKSKSEITLYQNINGKKYQIFNPSDEMLSQNGWLPYTVEMNLDTQESPDILYKQCINNLIREKYTIDDEIAFIRQKENKPLEFDEYNLFVEECKIIAKNEIYGDS